MDFEKLPRFKMDMIGIVCKVPEWENIFNVERSEIERQIGLAHGWCDCNPRKAPKVNTMRYLYNWLCIAQRKGSLLKKPRENYKETETADDLSIDEMIAIRKRNFGEIK